MVFPIEKLLIMLLKFLNIFYNVCMPGGVRFCQIAGAITTLKFIKNLYLLTSPHHCSLSSLDSATDIRMKKKINISAEGQKLGGQRLREDNGS